MKILILSLVVFAFVASASATSRGRLTIPDEFRGLYAGLDLQCMLLGHPTEDCRTTLSIQGDSILLSQYISGQYFTTRFSKDWFMRNGDVVHEDFRPPSLAQTWGLRQEKDSVVPYIWLSFIQDSSGNLKILTTNSRMLTPIAIYLSEKSGADENLKREFENLRKQLYSQLATDDRIFSRDTNMPGAIRAFDSEALIPKIKAIRALAQSYIDDDPAAQLARIVGLEKALGDPNEIVQIVTLWAINQHVSVRKMVPTLTYIIDQAVIGQRNLDPHVASVLVKVLIELLSDSHIYLQRTTPLLVNFGTRDVVKINSLTDGLITPKQLQTLRVVAQTHPAYEWRDSDYNELVRALTAVAGSAAFSLTDHHLARRALREFPDPDDSCTARFMH